MRIYTLKLSILFSLLLSFVFILPVQAVDFTVTRTDDPTPGTCEPDDCSLREAVIAANDNGIQEDTIILGAETYNLSIPNAGSPETGDLDVTGNLIVTGVSADSTIINAEPSLADRIFEIFEISIINFQISNVKLQNGDTVGTGGGIRFEPQIGGKLTVTDCIFENNEADGDGGAIAHFPGPGSDNRDLVVMGTTFINNRSTAGFGGGINLAGVDSILKVHSSVFTGNQAQGAGGGGIHCNTGSSEEFKIENTQFHNNEAATNGGAIECGGPSPTGLLKNLEIYENTAGELGGGIYWSSSGSGVVLSIEQAEVWGNTGSLGGGGFYFSSGARVEIIDSSFRMNETGIGMAGNGGGAHILSGGGAEIHRTTFNDNYSDNSGGGIYFFSPGTLDMVNSTLSGNEALVEGGGLYHNSDTDGFFGNNTIFNNTAGIEGGGVFSIGPDAPDLTNNIISENTAPTGPECSGTLMSLGYNIVGSLFGCGLVTVGSDKIGEDPKLASLADNGGPLATDVGLPPMNFGPPLTHALLDGSPAIDGGDPIGCTDEDGSILTTDERGQNRPLGSCDIGAYERGILTLSIDKVADQDPVTVGDILTFTITFSNDGPDIAFNPTLTDTLPMGLNFVSVSTSEGTCTNTSATITCLLNELASGGSVTVVIAVTADLSAIPNVTNVAQLLAVDADQVEADVTVTVNGPVSSSGCSCRLDVPVRARAYLGVALLGLAMILGLSLLRRRLRS